MNRRHLYLLGRVLLSSIFIVSAIGKLLDWSGNVQTMADKGLPLVAYFLAVALVIELLGGLALLFGFRTRWTAGLLFLYLIPVTLIMHNFWSAQGSATQMQLVNFLKNLAIMGGLLTVAAASDESVILAREPIREVRDELPLPSRAATRAEREENILHH